jgi:drug/metabolite transporter (DMT)-like permease
VSAGALLAGVALAAAAAACFDGAVALQAAEARAVPEHAGAVGFSLIWRLVRRPRWLAATALAVLGWPFQVAALSIAPLTVVQPTLALGLVLLLFLGARLLGEHAGTRDLASAAAIALGVGLLAWAAPGHRRVEAPLGTVAGVLGGLGLATALPWLVRRRAAGGPLVIAAGCGYAASGVASKLLADALGGARWSAALGWAGVTAAVAGLGFGDEQAALQRVSATGVAAGAFALQTAIPVLCAPVLTGEHWGGTPLGGGVIVAGLVLVVVGTFGLGSAPAVSRLIGGAPR